jgi:cytochrome c-type biogenesis protein
VNEILLLGVTAGMVAAVNPCGFALLPAYLALVIHPTQTGGNPVVRALAASTAMTLGFVAVFGAFGVVVVPFAISLGTALSWATVVIGVGLIGLGLWLVSGRDVVVRIPLLQWAAPTGGLPSMVLYGVAYAVASLSCTIAPFLAVTTTTFRAESVAAGIAVFVAYGLGMALVVSVLAVAVALAKEGFVRRVRGVLPYVGRISGVLLVLAGAYVAYYGLYELRVASTGQTDDPVIGTFTTVQGWIARQIEGFGPGVLLLVLAVLLIGGFIGTVVARSRRDRLDTRARTGHWFRRSRTRSGEGPAARFRSHRSSRDAR